MTATKTKRSIPVAKPTFGDEEERLLIETLRSGWVTQGPRVAEFEKMFAADVGAREAVAVSNCTTGLFLCLHALGIGAGDEVVVPSLSFIATANSVVHAGATPVFADIDPATYNLDLEATEAAITPRTKAVMVVHQLGLPVDLDRFRELCERRGVLLLEDAACASGSRYKGRPIGGTGDLACFSFHPRKILVTGEGGMITTEDAELAARLRRLRHQGMSMSDLDRHRQKRVVIEEYPEIGYNFRLSDLHAAVGIAQLRRLHDLVERRRHLGRRYDRALADVDGIELRQLPDYAETNYQTYILCLAGATREGRDRLLDELQARGVASRRGLMACHRELPYRDHPHAGPLPHTEAVDDQSFLLPIYDALSEDDQDFVVDQLRAALAAMPPR